jgi:hypothetical protein
MKKDGRYDDNSNGDSDDNDDAISHFLCPRIYSKVKVKVFRYKPDVAIDVPGG